MTPTAKERTRKVSTKGTRAPAAAVVEVVSSGEWLPVEEMHRRLSSALQGNKQVCLDVGGVDHIDANALQLLLAPWAEGRPLQLLHASPNLRQWLDYAGAGYLVETRGPKQSS